MTHTTIARAAALALALSAAPVLADQVYELTPEQRDAALFAAPVDETPIVTRDRAIHGEVSAFVGTGGARGLAGTAVIPLGEDGVAILSFEDSRGNGYRRYRR